MTDEAAPPTITPPPSPAQGLIARVMAMLTKPAETWDVIADEPSSVSSIYKSYIIPLAAIGPIVGAVAGLLVGIGLAALGGGFFMYLLSLILMLAVTYAISLGMVYVMALVIDGLAPSFDSAKNQMLAFKLSAYSMTAGWVAGIAGIIPVLGIVIIIAAMLYNCYLLYVGLPKLMKTPADKAVPYTAVIIVIGIVLYIIAGMVTLPIRGLGAMGMAGSVLGHHSSGLFGNKANDVNININTPDGKASFNLNQVAAAASSAAAQASAVENGTAAPVKVADPAALLALMPQTFMGAARSDDSTSSGGMGGMNASTARARYTIGDGTVTLEVSDTGGLAGLGGMMNAIGVNASSSSAGGYGKMSTEGNRMVTEEYNNDSKSGKYGLVIDGRFAVSAEGSNVDMATLKALAGSVDLGRAAALAK